MSNPNLVSPQVTKPGLSQEVPIKITVSEENISKQEKKERPLLLDPIVISYFGEFRNDLKGLIGSLYKAVHDTAQSKQQDGPDG